jgi:ABC-type transporter Mla maintaining outer membrane lipid asymmetry permease subunit MlaE
VPSLVRHIYEIGITAIPIVSLIAFLISVIVALLVSPETKGHVFTSELAVVP